MMTLLHSLDVLASVSPNPPTEFPSLGKALLYIAGIVFFLLLNAFFVASEFAIVKVRPSQLEAEGKAGSPKIKTALHVVNHLDSYLHVVIGELMPKSIAIRRSVSTTLLLAGPLHAFYRAAHWAIIVLNGTANKLLKVFFNLDPVSESEHSHSAAELAVLVTQSGASQEVTETEREILINALGLNELWVRDVMTPRNNVIVLDADEPFDKTLEIALRSKHTRFPLVKGHLDNSIGLIHIKDLFKLINDPDPDLMRIKRELKIVPDTMPLDTLLKFFLREHAHLALAVDEFGTPVGVVFLDNIIEELVGDIQDEFDNERSAFTRVNTDEFVVEGTMTLNDLGGHVTDLVLESGEVTTVGGYITQQLGRFPEVGETLKILSYEARVTSTDGRRVGQIHFRKLTTEESAGADGKHEE